MSKETFKQILKEVGEPGDDFDAWANDLREATSANDQDERRYWGTWDGDPGLMTSDYAKAEIEKRIHENKLTTIQLNDERHRKEFYQMYRDRAEADMDLEDMRSTDTQTRIDLRAIAYILFDKLGVKYNSSK